MPSIPRAAAILPGYLSRCLIACLICVSVVWTSVAHARPVTDITGQTVEIPDHVRRIILGEGRLIYALEPLEGARLFDRIVGWQGDLREADAQNYAQFEARFPEAGRIALIGQTSADTVSPERVLDLKPDLAIFSISGHGPGQSDAVTAVLRRAHVPVIFVDFRADPIAHTVPSMRILGQALDRTAQANAYADFYQAHLDRITRAVAGVADAKKPRVFIDMLAGTRACCHTAGRGNLGAFVAAAGGHNIAADLLPGFLGEISLEQVITSDPDIVIVDGTRGPDAQGPGLHMGARTTPDQARASLDAILAEPGLSQLRAVHDRHAFGLWHSFYNSPFNILAIERMAKWFYPERFADLDPDATRRELAARFTQIPPEGTFWISETP